MKFFIVSVFLFANLNFAVAEQVKSFTEVENTLVAIYTKITRFASEDENIANNKRFTEILDSVLRIPESFQYAFPNLKIGNVVPVDKSFRILSWSMIHADGTYDCFGFLQQYDKETKKVKVYSLKDKSRTLKNQLLLVCSPDSWVGATYYQIIQTKFKGDAIYTLIGWHPNNTFTQKKVIETLKFDKANIPVFGYPVVELKGRGFQRRIVYEYSSKNSMILRYDKPKRMIVMDHLAPREPIYTDVYEFYGPDFSMDGYIFKDGKWRFRSDIDIRNPRNGFIDYVPTEWYKRLFKIESNVVIEVE